MKEIFMRCLWFIFEFEVNDVYGPDGALWQGMGKARDLGCKVLEAGLERAFSSEGYEFVPLFIASTSRDNVILCSQELKAHLNLQSCEWLDEPPGRPLHNLTEQYHPSEIGSTSGFYSYSKYGTISTHNLKIRDELASKSDADE